MKQHWLLKSLFLLTFVLTIGISPYLHSRVVPPSSSSPRTTFVHLFEWTWADVAQECEAVLGPQGFAAVQISPPNEHVVLPERQYPWWQRYQPVSYRLHSRSGDHTQLVQMIRRCHAAGVKVYADAVINHMAGVEAGVGSAGSAFTKYHYPDLYQPQDFNTCRHNITNYQDRYDVTFCELVGLSDLKTRSPYVRQRLATYLQDLVRLGIDGFRIDAAKHIPADDLGAILSLLRQSVEPDPYIYQEVIDPGDEAIKKTEYYPHGDVFEFEYGRKVGEAFMGYQGQTISQLETLGERWGLSPSDKAIVFIDNHDKQRGHGGGGNYLTHKEGQLYILANIFMLAHPYGHPQVMSSYPFSDADQGPPTQANGHILPVYDRSQPTGDTCGSRWVCEHRWGAIARMVAFRNATATAPHLTHWWSNGRNQIAFGRGRQGFVVINREETPLTHTFQTNLPAGVYCNAIQSDRSADGHTCTDPTATVIVTPSGELTVTVAPMDAIALHVGMRLKQPS